VCGWVLTIVRGRVAWVRLARLLESERRAFELELEASFETPEQAKERYVAP
jgi:hypothetical protein